MAKDKKKQKSKEEKKKKQALKAKTKAGKKSKNSASNEEEDDLEALLRQVQLEDSKNQQIEIISLDSIPSPRNYFSVESLVKSNELLVFGGEFFDGDKSICFNDLFKFNPQNLSWKQIVVPNPPPPRCSHQSVSAIVGDKQKIYIFGGEFSTAHSFHHHRDLWEFDVESSTFKPILTPTGPSARSGHRMLLLKHFLVLFGGFYETARGTNFYNDVHFFNLRSQCWTIGKLKGNKTPDARSACHLFHDPQSNLIFLYGGYTKVKGRGKNLNDLWTLEIDLSNENAKEIGIKWERTTSKGDFCPSKRSGSSSALFKNKLILFGGVQDNETLNDVEGTFFNDLFSFDPNRKRWYPIEEKKNKSSASSAKKRNVDDEDNVQDIEPEIEDSDEKDEDEFDENAFYYIQDGKVVKVELEQDEVDDVEVIVEKVEDVIVEKEESVLKDEDVVEKKESVGEETSNLDLDQPRGRIGSQCFIVGNELFMMFGTAELQDYHVNFDDIWKINLVKDKKWICLHEGKWEESLDLVEVDQDDVLSDDGDGLSVIDDAELDQDQLKQIVNEDEEAQSILQEQKELSRKLECIEDGLIPERKEDLRSFFRRTAQDWAKIYLLKQQSKSESHSMQLQGKELRRRAFESCEKRFMSLLEILARLDELDDEREMLEREAIRQMKIDAIRSAGGKLKQRKE